VKPIKVNLTPQRKNLEGISFGFIFELQLGEVKEKKKTQPCILEAIFKRMLSEAIIF